MFTMGFEGAIQPCTQFQGTGVNGSRYGDQIKQ